MKLKKTTLADLSKLAKIKIEADQFEDYRYQLSQILAFVSQVKQVDTSNVEATIRQAGLVDVFRQDKVKAWPQDEVELALGQGELESGALRVKRVRD